MFVGGTWSLEWVGLVVVGRGLGPGVGGACREGLVTGVGGACGHQQDPVHGVGRACFSGRGLGPWSGWGL